MYLSNIRGTLKEFQHNNKAELMLLYTSKSGKAYFINISEYNYVILSPDPLLNPKWEIDFISGKEIAKCINKNDSCFLFNHEGIFYVLDTEYIPVEEALKVVESMLKQL
jgi:hypothetical protein